jgi:hypothetical protein
MYIYTLQKIIRRLEVRSESRLGEGILPKSPQLETIVASIDSHV